MFDLEAMCGKGYQLLFFVVQAAAVFFHEPSHVEIRPSGNITNETNFGFAISYQKVQNNLVVSAPHADLYGQVYKCPMTEILENRPNCQKLDINIQEIAPDTASVDPKQKFYLGASVAATSDYIFTCAPLWTTIVDLTKKDIQTDAFGTCFIVNNSGVASRYYGTFEQFKNLTYPYTKSMLGGTGWTTLLDEINNIILVANIALYGDIISLNTQEPLKATKSFVASGKGNNKIVDKKNNIGYALAAGNFFSKNNNDTCYAFSMQTEKKTGEIGFFSKSSNDYTMNLVRDQRLPKKIRFFNTGIMFGAAMGVADVNADGFADILVGAPAYCDQDEYDTGAVFIYFGNDKNTKLLEKNYVIISGKTDGSRFGSTIVTSDIDGDGLLEIVVSAPYETWVGGTGAVYILSGYEINSRLKEKHIPLDDLQLTQKIVMNAFQTFGYSLQVVPDVDDNGCDELAVGAPDNAAVLLFRCVPSINAVLTVQLLNDVVREYDPDFKAKVCVQVTYHPKPVNISTELFVDSSVIESGVSILNPNFTVHLSERKANYCEDVHVKFSYNESGVYTFKAEYKTVLPELFTSGNKFDNTWVTLGPYSRNKREISITRDCADHDCTVRLDLSILWESRNITSVNYTLGVHKTANLTVLVRNDGRSTKDGCLRVSMPGAQVTNIACGLDDDGAAYKCYLPRPMQRHAEYPLNVVLNMTKYTNKDKELVIDADLYQSCSHENALTQKSLKINFNLNTNDVYVSGSNINISVTDSELLNHKTETRKDMQVYTIQNKGLITWLDIDVFVDLEKSPFIKRYTVFTEQNENCSEVISQEIIKYHCKIDLKRLSESNIVVTTEIYNDKIVENLVNNSLHMTTNVWVFLQPTTETINKRFTYEIWFTKELSFGNNSWVIILSVIGALVILAIIAFIMYKVGFFKRKQKVRLQNLRESLKKSSVRQSTSSGNHRKSQLNSDEDNGSIGMDIEITEDSAFESKEEQLTNSSNNLKGADNKQSTSASNLTELENMPAPAQVKSC